MNFVYMRGHPTPLVVNGGDLFAPPKRRDPGRPKNILEKKNGVRARHGLRVSRERVGVASTAGWRT